MFPARRLLPALLAGLIGAAPVAVALDLAAVPPSDPAVRTGVLPNGMTYHVRANPKPENRVELRLAVRVGSIVETEEERGLAHFNEHMNFNGTANFAAGELVDYLESIGARFGADSNAYTNFDETVYFLQVPTDREEAVEQGLTILADWAGRANLDAEEIDKERGVVLDELRRGKGAWKRIRERQDQVLFAGSRYADRSTIGLEDVIQGASHETVRGFYRRWYRPENMAVIVVGAIDPEAMEARVREVFGALPASQERLDVPRYPVPGHHETRYSVETDPELTVSDVRLYWKHDPEDTRTVGDLRRDAVRGLATTLLTLRLSERTQKADPPFLGAGAGYGNYVDSLDVFVLSARAKDGELPTAAAALVEELRRALRFGFLEAELERARQATLSGAETRYAEREQRRSRGRASEMVRAFLDDLPLTSDEYDYQFVREVLPTIGLDEVNAALRELVATPSRVVLVRAPAGGEAPEPTVESIRAAVEAGEGADVAAYRDDLAGRELWEGERPSGSIVSRHAIPEIGVEEVLLGNGVRLVVKQTDFRNDQILLRGFALGGVADLEPWRWETAWRADTLANASGVAEFDGPQLRKVLAGRIAGASPSIGLFERSFGGRSTPGDLETMLQLVHLRFVQPAFRQEAFDRLVASEIEGLRNQLNSPNGVYSRAVRDVAYDGHPLLRSATVEEVEGLEMRELERAYRELFDDASEWTFVLVGNISVDEHGPLLADYLGSLPSSRTTPMPRRAVAPPDLSVRFPRNPVEHRVEKGVEDQSSTRFSVAAEYGLDVDEGFVLGALTDLLQMRLRERLREERGDTYGVGVGLSTLSPYPDYGAITFSFTSSPAARESMLLDVLAEIRRARRELPTSEEVAKLRELRYSSLEESLQENGYWAGRLRSAYLHGRDPRSILEARQRIDRLDARDVRRAARRWLDLDRTAYVYLVPEGWGEADWQRERPREAPAAAVGQ